MKKGIVLLILLLICTSAVACSFNEVEDINLSFYDGDELLKQTTLFKYQNGDDIVPNKEGYDFIGWFLDSEGTIPADMADIEGDCCLYAGWKAIADDKVYYNVTFYDYSGNEVATQKISSFEEIRYPKAPNRNGYTFSEWEGLPEVLDDDVELWARYLKICHIYFYARSTDDEPYATREVVEGGQIELPNDPKLPNDDQASFTFIGWSADFSNIHSDMIVYARFERVVFKYTYKFLDAQGNVLKSQKVDYGTAILPPSKVTKASDEAYAYSFIGWDLDGDGIADELPQRVISDFTAVPLFAAHPLSFSVNFYNGEELLQSIEVEYGSSAEYIGAEPTRESTAQFDYIFIGWDKSLDEILETTDFYAMYDSVTRIYSYSFLDEGGEVLSSGQAEYGTLIVPPTSPEKEATNKYEYTFIGWSDFSEGMEIRCDVEFVATFAESLRKYTYAFYVGGEAIKIVVAEYGEVIVPPDAPERKGLVFLGWAGGYYDGMTLDKDRTFTASWKSSQ